MSTYRTPDPIQRLRLDVRYRPVSDVFGLAAANDEDSWRVVKLAWQKKLFSLTELKHYRSLRPEEAKRRLKERKKAKKRQKERRKKRAATKGGTQQKTPGNEKGLGSSEEESSEEEGSEEFDVDEEVSALQQRTQDALQSASTPGDVEQLLSDRDEMYFNAAANLSHPQDRYISTRVEGDVFLPHSPCQHKLTQKMAQLQAIERSAVNPSPSRVVASRGASHAPETLRKRRGNLQREGEENRKQSHERTARERSHLRWNSVNSGNNPRRPWLSSLADWLGSLVGGTSDEDAYQSPTHLATRHRGLHVDPSGLPLASRRNLQVMQVIFNPPAEDEISEPVVICSLFYEDGGLLSVYPDFSTESEQQVYHVRLSTGHGFEFMIMHTSPAISFDQEYQEQAGIRELARHHAQSLRAQVGYHFETPLAGNVSVVIALVVDKITDFGDGRFYVILGADLSSHTSENSELFYQRTQLCHATKGLAHFGHVVDITLDIPEAEFASLRAIGTFYFQVTSVDGWGQQRVEGYGHLPLRPKPGRMCHALPTWRPRGSLQQERRSFFLGGSIEVSQLSHVAPARYLDPVASKANFSSIAGGHIHVTTNIAIQTPTEVASATDA